MDSKGRGLYLFWTLALATGYLWLYLNYSSQHGHTQGVGEVCLIKRATDIPCPSCGSTRSVLSLMQGDFQAAIYWNPLGLLIGLTLIVLPFWILYDLLFRAHSFLAFYRSAEKLIRRPIYAYPAIALIAINWVWNIIKG